MGCKELHVRVQFYRAKHALRQQLARQGITQTALGVGLGLFGLLTAHGKGVTGTIRAATLNVGFCGSILGALGTKVGMTLASCVGAFIVGFTLQKLALAVILMLMIPVLLAVVNLYVDA